MAPAVTRDVGRRDRLVRRVYGEIPPPPASLEFASRPWPEAGGEILTLAMSHGGRTHSVDAALFLPQSATGPVPVIVGLCFTGPLGAVDAPGFPVDPHAIVEATSAGFPDGRLDPAMRGRHAERWPRDLFDGAGCGLLLACYGSFTPDDPVGAFTQGIAPLMGTPERPMPALPSPSWRGAGGVGRSGRDSIVDAGERHRGEPRDRHPTPPTPDPSPRGGGERVSSSSGIRSGEDHYAPGAIALWAWAYSRLVDAALARPEIDPARIVVAGHSRLGKAALLAAAFDTRVSGVFANNSGCLGVRPSAIRRGETPEALAARFPHWVTPAFAADPRPPEGLDQQDLLASIAPRRVYAASAADDAWADPAGERAGLVAATTAWRALGCDVPEIDADAPLVPGAAFGAGPIGWHLRAGAHDLTRADWVRALPHLLEPPR
ncbi:glucuronyl esterase domain-containing protein [Salinarimonas sp. NSM]|uniref:glucuronyl esterase domain-containing protein n=1 Tax=Salinarimonas sp. NSM TaxID=3458003 RepID=UPI0040374685